MKRCLRLGLALATLTTLDCSGGEAVPPRSVDPVLPDAGEADATAPAGCAKPSLRALAWIDAHMHCSGNQTTTGDCDATGWPEASAKNGGGGGILLSTEHFAVSPDLGSLKALVATRNEKSAEFAKGRPELGFAASLECWHEVPFDDPTWVARCKADVDRWVAAGAVGFKDHTGKQEHGGPDVFRWIGSWNRFNGTCSVPPSEPNPNQACMTQSSVRYPLLEAKWREVLVYIVETQKKAVFTHAASPLSAPDRCHDPRTGAVDGCGPVTQRHLGAFAEWAAANLSPEARRRIVVVHLGFLAPRLDRVEQLLAAGLSTDTAAMMGIIGGGGCPVRGLLARYPKQILLGSDNVTGEPSACVDRNDGWFHLMTGRFGEHATFTNLCGTLPDADVVGLELQSPRVAGCANDVPPDLHTRIMKENLLEIIGCGAGQ